MGFQCTIALDTEVNAVAIVLLSLLELVPIHRATSSSGGTSRSTTTRRLTTTYRCLAWAWVLRGFPTAPSRSTTSAASLPHFSERPRTSPRPRKIFFKIIFTLAQENDVFIFIFLKYQKWNVFPNSLKQTRPRVVKTPTLFHEK